MGIKDLLSYAGKRVVVTGAASGMGKATVEYLAELGAWNSVIQGVIFVACVLSFRQGIAGEIARIAALLRRYSKK